ncbi:MAG: NAD(P)H-binding protein [Pseudomonadota bacterium]
MTENTVLLLGATGTIGRATLAALEMAGHRVIAPVRSANGIANRTNVTLYQGDPEQVLRETAVDAVISCVASRDGLDAWDIDYGLNARVLKAAIAADVPNFVLLSAICVQKPMLAFQHAKLAFEAELREAPLTWSIVRPTAFFKSLSGQVSRLRQGKRFLLFGDGKLTRCKPISDRDIAQFLVLCLSDPARQNKVLPIGGPGAAITPQEQGEMLFDALGMAPKFRHVPLGMMRAIIAGLTPLSGLSSSLRTKAELARIGYYYATESMVLWDEGTGQYVPNKTPEFGADRLIDHYRALARGEVADNRREHAVF